MRATVAQIEAEAKRLQAEVGEGFKIQPNSYGVRAECVVCRASSTHDRAYRFVREHKH